MACCQAHRYSVLCAVESFSLRYLLPIFYGDLVYKLKRIVGKPHFSDQFKKIIRRYVKVGDN